MSWFKRRPRIKEQSHSYPKTTSLMTSKILEKSKIEVRQENEPKQTRKRRVNF